MTRVALIRGEDRYENIKRALEDIEGDIHLPSDGVLIKPNFVSTRRELAATHVEAVRALLDFLRPRYEGSIVIGEGSPSPKDTSEGYHHFGYEPLVEEYGVSLIDFNRDEGAMVQVYDRSLHPLELWVAKTAWESPYRISIGPPKIHDEVIVTLSLKNMIMGSLITPDQRSGHLFHALSRTTPSWIKRAPLLKGVKENLASTIWKDNKVAMHQGYPVLNLNLYTLAKYLSPHLSIIDGFQGMEGAGPVSGEPVELGLAVASTDFLAADTVAAKIMGYDIEEIGYLYYCKVQGLGVGDLGQMEIVGNARLEDSIRPFRPHPTHNRQREWKFPDVERFL